MNIKQTFLDLTKHTVPYLKEKEYLKDLLPMDILKEDPVGNLYVKIGNGTAMFAAHLDTVGGDKVVNHVIEGKMIKTDGKSILGADDKAGVVILLYMIEHNIPGIYQFFLGEEVGCKGSKPLVTWIEKNKNDERYKDINKVISFDRKDVDSVITYQLSERCCSDDFANSLIKEFGKNGLKYRKDTGGVLTDSVHFTDLYAECTNLSVGYWSQHTNNEKQDIEFLESLCKACVKTDWEGLTIKRKPGETERLSYGSYGRRSSNYSNYNDWEDEYDYGAYGGGYSSGWKSTRKSINSEYVTDWRGDKQKSEDVVYCEFDKQWCLRDEAIWVDLLGFYTTPDENTPRKNKVDNKSEDYTSSKNDIIKSSRDIGFGDVVIHPTFGKGKIEDISPDGKKVKVNFYNSGSKQILLSIAKMKKM